MSREKAIPAEPPGDDVRPRRQKRERLPSSVLEDLWSIWRADPRVPSIRSRRSWAISHNANPRLVDCWFIRRRACAKKAGRPIPDDSYDLPLDPPIVPKREQSPTPDLPSDDTLVYPPDIDDPNDNEASSDTVFDEDETKRVETTAYKEVPQQSCLEQRHSQPEPSSVGLCAAGEPNDEVALLDSFLVCHRGREHQSNFTSVRCSTDPTRDKVVPVRANLSSCPRPDFLSDTPSELSAIPFLFRTPRAVSSANTVKHQHLNNWSTIEEELGRLVNDGELDFSFLDVPELASMELPD